MGNNSQRVRWTGASQKNLGIIYDGLCAFCIRTLKVLKKWDVYNALVFYDFHDEVMMRERFPMVKFENAEAAMPAVTEEAFIWPNTSSAPGSAIKKSLMDYRVVRATTDMIRLNLCI